MAVSFHALTDQIVNDRLCAPVDAARLEAAEPAGARARCRARGCGDGPPPLPDARLHRRRQIVRRPDDVAGAGGRRHAGGRRPGVPGLSAASGRQARRRPCQASLGRRLPDAVPAKNARRLGRARPPAASGRRSGIACDLGVEERNNWDARRPLPASPLNVQSRPWAAVGMGNPKAANAGPFRREDVSSQFAPGLAAYRRR